MRIFALAIVFSVLALDVRAQSSTPVAPAAPAAPAEPSFSNDTPTAAPASPAASDGSSQVLTSAEGDYVLTPGDTIEMTIFREPDLTARSTIARDGTVQLPLIKEVSLAGKTVRDARALLRGLYDAKYLVNPQVYLNVIGFAQRRFTILGQVLKPGSYALQGGQTLSLLEVIGMAGGFTRIADQGKILIRRSVAGESVSLKANAKRIADGRDESVTILPGDVITVGESWY
ncbi:MAG: polysaccharide biosynthesis/export family protein [Chthoniobacterales bacterium]